MPTQMADAVELRCGDMHLRVRPDVGGSIEGLWFQSMPVLRSKIGLTSPREGGGYPLVPYSNRIALGCLHWQGQLHSLRPLFTPEPHSIHGTGWLSHWAVQAKSDATLVLQHIHLSNAAWPFSFVCSQTFALTRDTLTLSLHITNTAPCPAPVGLGWHPYVVKRRGAHIRFAAKHRWEMSVDKLPTHPSPHQGLDQGCDNLVIDHCFDGWAGGVDVQDDVLHTHIESSLNRLVVFTDPARDFIAIEPVSHVNNALGQMRPDAELVALGVQTLVHGQSYSASMRISAKLCPTHSKP